MKQALVVFPCGEDVRERLAKIGENRCAFSYKEPDWTPEQYHTALKNAHIIIGEPRNEDFAYCEHLQWMQSPSSGVNYYMDGGKFPKGAILTCMTGGNGSILAEHLLAMVLAL